MKRYLIIIFVILLTLLCNNIVVAQNHDEYQTTHIEVLRIDTLLDNYIIYAKSETSRFKIATWKCSICCENVCVGDKLLVSLIGESDLSHHVGYARGRDRIGIESKWGAQLFYVKEIYGLCYTQDEKISKEYEQWLTKVFFPTLKYYYPPYLYQYKQNENIKFLNDTCTINIDTIKDSQIEKFNNILMYEFVNTEKDTVFMIDTVIQMNGYNDKLRIYRYKVFEATPNETKMITLNYDEDSERKDDNLRSFYIPFSYDGKRYWHKLYYKLTFEKSKLVDKEQIINVDTIVERLYLNKDKVNFTVYCKVTNISNDTILCTGDLYAYHDSPDFNKWRYDLPKGDIKIAPMETYKIPIRLIMNHKYRFDKRGYFYVVTRGRVEKIEIQVVSKYKPYQ